MDISIFIPVRAYGFVGRWCIPRLMMRRLVPAVTLLTALSPPALASQTACVFSASQASHYYELEFIGYSDVNPVIVFSSTAFGFGKRFTLSPADYTLKSFNQKAGRVSLDFRNPQDPALPPSFGLIGTSGRARLKIGSSVIEGELKCDS